MSSRIAVRCSAYCMIHLKNIRHKVTLPNEFARRPLYVPLSGYVLLTIPATFAALTIYHEAAWYDLQRKMRDEAYESIKPLVDLPAHDLKEVMQMNFRHVRIRGHFDYDREVYVLNQRKRTGVESLKKRHFEKLFPAQKMTYDDRRLHAAPMGHWVITPFVLSDGRRILVNRGWVPLDQKDPTTRSSGQVHGEFELTGYVRILDQKAGYLDKWRNHPESGEYRNRNIRMIAADTKSLPIWVDLDRDSTDKFPGGPIGGQTSLEYVNDEEYESIWSCLAFIATMCLWYMKFVGPVRFRHQY